MLEVVKKEQPKSWTTVVPVVHQGQRRIGRLEPLRIEPGRNLTLGTELQIRRWPYRVIGFGYEFTIPIVHVLRLKTDAQLPA